MQIKEQTSLVSNDTNNNYRIHHHIHLLLTQ